MRVRMVRGCGLALSFGKLPGLMCSKYMLVDGERVMFGSYRSDEFTFCVFYIGIKMLHLSDKAHVFSLSCFFNYFCSLIRSVIHFHLFLHSFTWTTSRMNRNTITVMSGQVVEFFDNDFRELYAVSEKVDLYHEFHIPNPPGHVLATPLLKALPTITQPALPASSSRFQVSLKESKQVNLKVPAHKYHNPKYALVVGNTLGLTGSLQDLTRLREYTRNNSESNMEKLLHTSRVAEEPPDKVAQEEMRESKEDVNKSSLFGSKKQRSSFRLFLKGRSPNQSPDLKTTNRNSADGKTANHSQANLDMDMSKTDIHFKDMLKLDIDGQDMQKPGIHVKDTPKPDIHVKDSPNPANHIKDTPKPANHIRETLKPAYNIRETSKSASEIQDLPKADIHVRDLPQLVNHNQDSPKPVNHVKDTSQLSSHSTEFPMAANHVKEVQPESSQLPNGKHTKPSPLQAEPQTVVMNEFDNSFVIIEKPNLMKYKGKKSSKLPQRSVSMQAISIGAEEGRSRSSSST